MRKFMVEREIPEIGSADRQELKAVARSFNDALRALGSEIQWVESYVAADKTFCVFFAPDGDTIRQYAKRSGFPVDKVTEITTVIDPTTTGSERSTSAAG